MKKFLNICLCPIEESQTGAYTLGVSGSGSNVNKILVHILQISSATFSPSRAVNCHNPWNPSLRGVRVTTLQAIPSAYSTAPPTSPKVGRVKLLLIYKFLKVMIILSVIQINEIIFRLAFLVINTFSRSVFRLISVYNP